MRKYQLTFIDIMAGFFMCVLALLTLSLYVGVALVWLKFIVG